MGKKQKLRHRLHKPMTKEVLAKWRERMGYTPNDCAHELGCTIAEWRAWESGAIKIPRYIGLACTALGMSMHAYGEVEDKDE
jgi:DNA-binding transcriptional regulator YiaG